MAVFFSRKHFTFSDHYLLPLSQFIRSGEDKQADVEDIRQQTLIQLAEDFCSQAPRQLGADSVYFLNAFPALAQNFVSHYSSDARSLAAMGEAFQGTDLILVVNPLTLGGYQTSSVYARSNRIITEKVMVKTAHIEIYLYDPRTGNVLQTYSQCFDERKDKVAQPVYDFHNGESPMGLFFAGLFSRLNDQLLGKGMSGCE